MHVIITIPMLTMTVFAFWLLAWVVYLWVQRNKDQRIVRVAARIIGGVPLENAVRETPDAEVHKLLYEMAQWDDANVNVTKSGAWIREAKKLIDREDLWVH